MQIKAVPHTDARRSGRVSLCGTGPSAGQRCPCVRIVPLALAVSEQGRFLLHPKRLFLFHPGRSALLVLGPSQARKQSGLSAGLCGDGLVGRAALRCDAAAPRTGNGVSVSLESRWAPGRLEWRVCPGRSAMGCLLLHERQHKPKPSFSRPNPAGSDGHCHPW